MTTTTILSDNGVSSGSAGIKTTGGNDGTLALQTTTSGGTATTALTIDNNQAVTIQGLTVGKGAGAVSTNTAVGASALAANTTGASNTVVGYQAAFNNTTANSNTVVGYQTAYRTTTGADLTAIGQFALFENTTGGQNTALGRSSLQNNTTASNNTAVGYQAGYSQTTGAGGFNVLLGYQAGYTNNNYQVTYLGYQAGYNATGANNTFIGANSGDQITSGTRNTILGRYNGNQDSLDIRTQSNYVVLSDGDGNRAAFWQSGGGWVQKNNSTSWSTFSDQRIKENVINIENGLEVISALRPVEFDYIQTGKHDIGFIAQEYRTVLPDQVVKQTGIDEATKELVDDDHILSVQQNLVPYLVSAIKELKAELDEVKAQLKGAQA